MATSGEGAASDEGGGAGGKFRKRPFRRPQTTPYDRLPASVRNPNAKGWLSKLVDPASKLIMTSAQMFFSSVFQKRLPPPPRISHPQPEADQEPRDILQEAVPNNYTGGCNTSNDQAGNSSKSSDGNPISDLEQLLKQKTFTRSESDSLMALLRSRTVDLPVGVEDRTGKNLSHPHSDLEKKDINRSQGIFSPPIVSSRGIQENVASPAEFAKAYMGTKPTNVSPSMLGSNNPALRGKSTLTNNQALALISKSPTMIQSSNSSGGIGVQDNGFSSKKYRGRSAIYSMARSPYFGVHPTVQKGSGFMNDGFGGEPPSSSSRLIWENGGHSHSKRADLKRISSALDDEVGTGGTIRRVRQKPNLSSQGNIGNGVAFHQHHVSSSQQKHLLSDEAKQKTKKIIEENGDSNRFTSTSSEMGTKILQHLEKLTPKQKSSESKLVIGGSEKSPTKLTSNMLSGQALRSLEHVDSSKFMRDPQSCHKSENLKKDTVEENCQKMLTASRDTLDSSIHADTASSLIKDAVLNAKGADTNHTILAAQPPQKGRSFQMSALEDFVELDEDMGSDEPQLALPVEEREKTEKCASEMKAVPAKALEVDKYPAALLPEDVNVMPTGSVSKEEITDFDNNGGEAEVCAEKNGFTFSPLAAPVISATTFETSHLNTESISVPVKDPNDSLPVFSFNSKIVDKVPSFTFSPSPTVVESSEAKPASPFGRKAETLNRLENVSSGTTDAQPEVTASSDKGGNNNNFTQQNCGDTKGNLETVPSAVSTSPSTSEIFSFTAINKNSNPNNGSLTSTTPIFSSTFPVLPSTSSDQTINNSFTQPVSSASTHTITSTAAAATAAVPSVPAPPIFSFGSSVTPTAPLTTPPSSIAETLDSNAKTENKQTFGNGNSSPFGGGTSFATTTSASTFFGSNPTANNQSQAPLFGTNSGSLISTQPSSSSGITPFTSGNSLFGSTSSSEMASVSTASSYSSVTFGSSWKQPDKSQPLFPNPFSSQNQSTGFSFGPPPTSSTATNTAPSMVFGSSTGSSSGPVFTFGSATTASSTTSSLLPLPQVQPVFGSTPVFNASSANNDQMSMEDSMAEDTIQASAPGFGQQPVFSTPAGFMLGSTAPAQANPFQFGGQTAQQNPSPSPFQASSSLEFNAGGSFSLGSGAGDKSSRRLVRVSKNRNRKKP